MYFCKNCGEPYMTDEAVMCVKCGVAKGQGNRVSFPSYLDAAPDGSAHCLESVVLFAQYLPTSRARPAWQRLD